MTPMNQRALWISVLTVWLAACGSDDTSTATNVQEAG